MEALIPRLYRNYGDYVNKHKMLPSSVDGTIPVWRRILLGAHTVARREFVKSATVFGHVIGHWHPHSEAIQGTAEILVQNGFLDGKGNWGTTIGIEPMGCAAPRYTSIRMNSFIEDIAFKYVNDVDWIVDELDPEPAVLPSMVPLCLFAKYEFNMIAFGFKTEFPNYRLSDLIKRLFFLIGKGSKVIIKPNIIGCKIKSSDEDLEKLLATKGRHSLQIEGTYTNDPKNYRVYIHGWSPRSNFSNVFNRIDSYEKWGLLDKGDVSYIDESTDSVGTKIRFEVSKARNREKIHEQLLEAVRDRLTSSISFNMYVVTPEGNVEETTVDQMLLNAYHNFIAVLKVHFAKRIKDTQAQIVELKIIEKIKPHLHKVLILKTPEEMITKLCDLTGLAYDPIEEVIGKHKIKKLMTVSTELTGITTELQDLQKNLVSVDQYALDRYKELLKAVEVVEKEEDKELKHRTAKVQQANVADNGIKPVALKTPANGRD